MSEARRIPISWSRSSPDTAEGERRLDVTRGSEETARRAAQAWADTFEGLTVDAPTLPVLSNARPESLAGGVAYRRISSSLDRSVVELARRESVSPFVVMLTAFSIAIHRLSGEPTVIVGTGAATRHPDEANAVGF